MKCNHCFPFLLILSSYFAAFAQMSNAPDRTEGDGPYDRLIIRSVTMIDGTGSPVVDPVDIVISEKRITDIQTVGYPGVSIDENNRPKADENSRKNLKIMYGTCALRVNDQNEAVRVGGVKYTIKNGIICDAQQLLDNVEQIVNESKKEMNYEITQPTLDY